MRENMLLQYADDIIKVEMGSLRAELLRLVPRIEADRVKLHERQSATLRVLVSLFPCFLNP